MRADEEDRGKRILRLLREVEERVEQLIQGKVKEEQVDLEGCLRLGWTV